MFKISVIKLYILWLFGDRNINIEQHIPDEKMLPFMKDISSKQFLHVSWIFQPYKGRGNSHTLPHLSFKSMQHTSHHLSAILQGRHGDHCEVSELFQEQMNSKPSDPRKLILGKLQDLSSPNRVVWKGPNENALDTKVSGKNTRATVVFLRHLC